MKQNTSNKTYPLLHIYLHSSTEAEIICIGDTNQTETIKNHIANIHPRKLNKIEKPNGRRCRRQLYYIFFLFLFILRSCVHSFFYRKTGK